MSHTYVVPKYISNVSLLSNGKRHAHQLRSVALVMNIYSVIYDPTSLLERLIIRINNYMQHRCDCKTSYVVFEVNISYTEKYIIIIINIKIPT